MGPRRWRPYRHAAGRRFHSDDAAEIGWSPARSATVRPESQRPEARRQRRRRTARRSAGGKADIPGIARDAMAQALGDALVTEFGGCRLADDHRSRFAQMRDRGGVVIPRLLGIGRFRPVDGKPTFGRQQVLDRNRHAVEGADRFASPPPRGRRADKDKGVQPRIMSLDALQNAIGHVDRGEVPAAVSGDQFPRRQVCQFRHGPSGANRPFQPDTSSKAWAARSTR